MYVCSNCGMAFDGRVCPGCCTMRPAAAVLGSSGRILKDHNATLAAPENQAAMLAEELEYSRQANRWRSERKHDEEVRARAAQLAEAARRQQEKPPAPSEAEQRYARQAQKAVNWTRKAPTTRTVQPEVDEVELTDALRTLRISGGGDAAQKKASPAVKPAAAQQPVCPPVRSMAYPASPGVPQQRSRSTGRAPASSERIDAAWRSFANKEPASGTNVTPKLSDNAGSPQKAPPRPPVPPVKKG